MGGEAAAICNSYRFPSEARQKCSVSLPWTASLQLHHPSAVLGMPSTCKAYDPYRLHPQKFHRGQNYTYNPGKEQNLFSSITVPG